MKFFVVLIAFLAIVALSHATNGNDQPIPKVVNAVVKAGGDVTDDAGNILQKIEAAIKEQGGNGLLAQVVNAVKQTTGQVANALNDAGNALGGK